MEKTQMPLNWRMDKKNVVHLHMEYYSAVKNNDILKFADKLMDLEKAIVCEVSQTQKDKYSVYSFISDY